MKRQTYQPIEKKLVTTQKSKVDYISFKSTFDMMKQGGFKEVKNGKFEELNNRKGSVT